MQSTQVIMHVNPWWAALVTWGIVNLVNLLQSVGFFSRVLTGSMAINHTLGYGIIALAIPAGIALVAFIREGAGWQQWVGLVLFLAFIAFSIAVEHIWIVEFRTPRHNEILIPYLVLFFSSILLMGLPMFQMDRRLWLVTVVTTVILMCSMVLAMRKGVG